MARERDQGEQRHIVDLLIEERAPVLLHRPVSAWLMRQLLYPVLGYAAARATVDRIQGLPGAAVMDLAVRELALRVAVLGLARLPRAGRVVIAANHPTGLADGVAVWQAFRRTRPDLMMLANGDAIRIAIGDETDVMRMLGEVRDGTDVVFRDGLRIDAGRGRNEGGRP